jgi:hypothetical protein
MITIVFRVKHSTEYFFCLKKFSLSVSEKRNYRLTFSSRSIFLRLGFDEQTRKFHHHKARINHRGSPETSDSRSSCCTQQSRGSKDLSHQKARSVKINKKTEKFNFELM